MLFGLSQTTEELDLFDLLPVLLRNWGVSDYKEALDLTQRSATAVCHVTLSLLRADPIPGWVFAPTSLIGKFTRVKCWVVRYFPLTFIHGQFKSFCFIKLGPLLK